MKEIHFEHSLGYRGVIYTDMTYDYDATAEFKIQQIVNKYTNAIMRVESDVNDELREAGARASTGVEEVEMTNEVKMQRILSDLHRSPRFDVIEVVSDNG